MTIVHDEIRQLPSPNQVWAHSTCSVESLNAAIHDVSITAIETDILFGTDVSKPFSSGKCPILAHPPDSSSNLSFERFVDVIVHSTRHQHIKLDFKDIDYLDSVLQSLSKVEMKISPLRTIFLNADILLGPGKRIAKLQLTENAFIGKCLEFLAAENRLYRYAFSLGYMVDCRSLWGYTYADAMMMQEVIDRNSLIEHCQGIVLALNARILCKRLDAFDKILHDLPQLQVLAWTGTGEPPISKYQIEKIRRHFVRIGKGDIIGFDCSVARSFFAGLLYDWIVRFVSIFWNLRMLFLRFLAWSKRGHKVK